MLNALDGWGWLITAYLFLSGLGAGLYASIAGLETFKPGITYKRTLIWGVNFSGILLILGLVMFVVSLGNPERVYRAILYPHLTSPLSWSTILLFTLIIFCLLYWLAQTGFLLRTRVPKLWKPLNQFRSEIVTLGGIIAFMTSASTGIILLYARHSLWNNPFVPLLFLISALGIGFAFFLIIAKLTGEIEQSDIWKSLFKLMIILGVLELIVVLFYSLLLPPTALSALLNLDTIYGKLFIIIFLTGGVFIGKIGLFIIKMRNGNSQSLFISAPLILISGFVLRYVVVSLGPLI